MVVMSTWPALEEIATYIIFKDGNLIVAKNGKTGKRDYSGTDAASVIQSAVDHGGLIFIKEGHYLISSPISITKTTWIQGAGMDWHTGEKATVLEATADMTGENGVFEFEGEDRVHFTGISDLTIYNPTGRAKNAIYAVNISDAVFRRLYLNQGTECGIYILGTSMDMWNIWIEDCLIENMTLTGIRIDPAANDITKVHILNNYIYSCDLGINLQEFEATGGTITWVNIKGNHVFNIDKVGIMLWKDAAHVDISHNLLYDCGSEAANTFNAIRVGDGNVSGDRCQYVNIHDNIVHGNSVSKYGISLEDYSDNIHVVNNIVHDCATAGINAEATVTNYVIRENLGHQTENSGTATIPNGNTSVVVNHGLVAAPSVVLVTGTHSEVASPWITNITATQFTINVSGAVTADRDLYWRAEV